jgi:plasmid stability protein
MKTVTIRGIDDKLAERIKSAAAAAATSVNQWVLTVLREATGLKKPPRHTKIYHDLDQLFGAWTDEEWEEFQKSQARFESIDEEMWR